MERTSGIFSIFCSPSPQQVAFFSSKIEARGEALARLQFERLVSTQTDFLKHKYRQAFLDAKAT